MESKFIFRLKLIMEQKAITQAELAKRAGIRQSSISDWLAGKYQPKQDKIAVIADALNISPGWLLGYDPDDDQYYIDKEAAEYAEMLRTRPGARMLFSAAKDISKEDMEKAVEYIELLKLKNK